VSVLIIIVTKYKPRHHLTSSFAIFWIWDISSEDIIFRYFDLFLYQTDILYLYLFSFKNVHWV